MESSTVNFLFILLIVFLIEMYELTKKLRIFSYLIYRVEINLNKFWSAYIIERISGI